MLFRLAWRISICTLEQHLDDGRDDQVSVEREKKHERKVMYSRTSSWPWSDREKEFMGLDMHLKLAQLEQSLEAALLTRFFLWLLLFLLLALCCEREAEVLFESADQTLPGLGFCNR